MLTNCLPACAHLSITVSEIERDICEKIVILSYPLAFDDPWRRPCDYHAICCMGGKTIQCLPNPSQHVPIYLQQFPSYTMLKPMPKSKNRSFYHIFVSPVDAPWTITLNVVWMEREFDAYKLSPCMCPSNYNRFWDRARYLWKNRHFIIPLAFDAPIRGFPSEYCHPVWYGKTRMVGLPDSEKNFEDMYNGLGTIPACDRQTDGQTDRQTDTA